MGEEEQPSKYKTSFVRNYYPPLKEDNLFPKEKELPIVDTPLLNEKVI